MERMRRAVKDGHQLKQTSSKTEKVQKDKAMDR